MKKQELAKRIYDFLDKYAVVVPDYQEGDDVKYSSPDAYQLLACAYYLRVGKKLPQFPFSDWGSGGYKPYSSEEGRKEHDFLLQEIKKHM